MPSPADAVSLPRMAPRKRPVVPRRTSCTPTMHTSRTTMAMTKKAWPLGLKMPRPTHWGLTSEAGAVGRRQLGEDSVVEEQGGGDGQQGQAQPPEPDRGERQDDGHQGGGHRTDQAAEQQAQPQVVGQLGGGEGPDPGQGGLGQRELAAHAGDQSDGQEHDRVDQPGVEHVLPGRRHPGQHGHHEGAEQQVPTHPDHPVDLGGPERRRRRRGGRVDRGQGVLGACPGWRRPGTTSRATIRTMKGREVSAAEDHTLLTGR